MVTSTVDTGRHEIVAVIHTLVWDNHGRNLLLLERANTGLMDGRLTLPGGHLQAGETLVYAAAREVREEVGIELEQLSPCCVLPYAGGVNFVFSSTKWQGSVRNVEPEFCARVGWFDRNQLTESTVPWLAKALELHDTGGWFYDFSER
ncbi:MAG: NUDIX domain-containing protein [Gammaproteobacteria bacterium]|nr:NUDIX domain-containing protein [Gammaproteobacteria bacterium]